MTVLVGRRESFNAAHQLCDPDLSDDENLRSVRGWETDKNWAEVGDRA